jgi:hypothetical protein
MFYAAGLPESSLEALMMAAASASQTALLEVGGMTPSILRTTNIAVSDAYSKSYAYVYYFAVTIGVLAIAASLCMRDFDKYLNTHISRQPYDKRDAHTDPLETSSMPYQTASEGKGSEKTAA